VTDQTASLADGAAPDHPAVIVDPEHRFDVDTAVAIVGAGAAGLVAALAAREGGADVLVLEADPSPSGSTSLSSGFVPACATRWQAASAIADSVDGFVEDMRSKTRGGFDEELARAYATAIGPTLGWLADRHGIAFELVPGLRYPGHGVDRMHALPQRTGQALQAALLAAARAAGVTIATQARAVSLVCTEPAEGDSPPRVGGLVVERPDGRLESIGCRDLILACNGFGGNPEMVRRYLPEMAQAMYFGHPSNQGDAVRWGIALGARLADMGAYQGHGSVAVPHGILITWALMTGGGIQVDRDGRRFSNETDGYSEQAVRVLAQPGQEVWCVFDERLHRFGLDFPDYRQAVEAGAVRVAGDVGALAGVIGAREASLAHTFAQIDACVADGTPDTFGRRFAPSDRLVPPFRAVRVTGALFHTQGGLAVDATCRVLDHRHRTFPNLLAAGGAARGVSGPRVEGYLSGNGLLSAIAGGAIAGSTTARPPRSPRAWNAPRAEG
jgi:fumarate reductase flavoprotein subunit